MKDKTVRIDMDDHTFLKIAKEAHENNITFNHMVERIVWIELLKALGRRDEPSLKTKKKQSVRKRSKY